MPKIKKLLQYWPTALVLLLLLLAMSNLKATITVGPSMEPTFHDGDILLVANYWHKPQKGDAVLVEHNGELWVKRIEAVGADNVDGTQVPENCVYLVGDNRAESYDSRHPDVGPIPIDNILGKVILKLKSGS